MARDSAYDPKGERGGDTGPTKQQDKGKHAEKGDQRRETPVHAGPTHGGTHGTTNRRAKRSGSDSNRSQ